MTKRFPAFALWRSTARFSREVLTPSTTSGRSRYSTPSPPTRRWCWRISKSTRNPTKFRRRKSFWKNSALRTASSRSTRCTVKKTFEAAAAANAHLIVQLKENQLTLCRNVEAVCRDATLLSGVRTIDDKKRNRHETRIVGVFDAAPAVAGMEWEPFGGSQAMDAAIGSSAQARQATRRQGKVALGGADGRAHREPLPELVRHLWSDARTLAAYESLVCYIAIMWSAVLAGRKRWR